MLFNRVLGLGVAEPASEIHRHGGHCALSASGCASLWNPTQPDGATTCFDGLAAGSSLAARDNWAKVYRAAEPIEIHTDLRVESIGPVHAADFAQVACTAFGMPLMVQPWLGNLVGRENWHAYLAFDGEAACGVRRSVRAG
jgi:hypothetical protein